ncbi:MAG: hypothetical protein BZ138_03695 [Methanosphaera sp. rholeuAM270]|nr:MAG: hypothetical protein BZ138_03695 [Methanosphaera sp. rholeuAM270]
MQDPVKYNPELIKISPDTAENKYASRLIADDLSKGLLKNLKNNELDYFLFDLNFESKFGIFISDNRIYTNNYWDYPKTKLFKNMKNVKKITMMNNPKKYLELFGENFDKFYKYMKKNYPNTKLVLNRVKLTNQVYRSDGTMFIDETKSKLVHKQNPLIEKLEDYIIDNYDIHVIDGREFAVGDENHIWGISPGHYKKGYYKYTFSKFKEIALNDKLNDIEENHKTLTKESYDLKSKLKILQTVDNIAQPLEYDNYCWNYLLHRRVPEGSDRWKKRRLPSITAEKDNITHNLGRYYYNIFEAFPLDSTVHNISISFYLKTTVNYLWVGLKRYINENKKERGIIGSAFYSTKYMKDGVTPVGSHVITFKCDDDGLWTVYFDDEKIKEIDFKLRKGFTYYPVLYNPRSGKKATYLEKIVVNNYMLIDDVQENLHFTNFLKLFKNKLV